MFLLPLNFLFLICGQNDTSLATLSQQLASQNTFSKIVINLSEPCRYADLAQFCDNNECVIAKNGKIQASQFIRENKKLTLVDLNKTQEANTGYKHGAAEVWEKLENLTEDRSYRNFLRGLKYSITVHIAAFYKKSTGFYFMNLFFFKSRCLPEEKPYFNKLLKFVLNSIKKIDPKKFSSFLPEKELSLYEQLLGRIESTAEYDINPMILDELDTAIEILNCVACEKCKLWGKIQFTGLKACIKVHLDKPLSLDEFIFATNLLTRLLVSEKMVAKMESLDKSRLSYFYLLGFYHQEILGFLLSAVVFFLFKRFK